MGVGWVNETDFLGKGGRGGFVVDKYVFACGEVGNPSEVEDYALLWLHPVSDTFKEMERKTGGRGRGEERGRRRREG